MQGLDGVTDWEELQMASTEDVALAQPHPGHTSVMFARVPTDLTIHL